MQKRVIVGSVAAGALLCVVALDACIAGSDWDPAGLGPLLRCGSLIPLVFAAVIVVCVLELARLLRATGHRPHVGWATLCCVVLMLSPWLCAAGVLGQDAAAGLWWQLIWVTIAVLGTAVAHLPRGGTRTAIADVAATWFVVIYLGLLPSFAVQMRCDGGITDPAAGAWLVLIVLAVVFATDIGALYVGRAVGRHKLAPSISPGKSIEGFLGGILAGVAVVLALRGVAAVSVVENATFAQAFVFAVVISISAQLGDLFESLLKRSAQVKDSSGLVPGMGGVLDVIDGALFAVPVAWFLLTKLWRLV